MSNVNSLPKRRVVIVSIMIVIAIFHIFPFESYLLKGDLTNYYYSYFSDITIPFGFYFLLFLMERHLPSLKRWEIKLAVAFLVPSIAETCQYFGLPVLGSTFDLLDYVMYGLGTVSAVIVDTQVFSRMFAFWDGTEAER
jgi:hypothetical protein